MLLDPESLKMLGPALRTERERQKLTREQAAAVCGVSPSFIRDAEDDPGTCTLGKLVLLCKGLGLTMSLNEPAPTDPHLDPLSALARDTNLSGFGLGNLNPVFRHEKSFGLNMPVGTALRRHIARQGLQMPEPGLGVHPIEKSTARPLGVKIIAATGLRLPGEKVTPPQDKPEPEQS